MASEVEICNRGLQKLGAKRIVSLDEDSVNGRACSSAYAILRDAELRAHSWNFAIKRAQLAASSTAPLFGKTAAYPLPSDFLRLLSPDPSLNLNDLDLQIENGSILTDEDAPLNIRYIWQVTDPNQMDVLFREALSSKMSLELAEALTQSNSKKTDAQTDYDNAIRRAKRTNAIENIAADPPEDTWVTVRL